MYIELVLDPRTLIDGGPMVWFGPFCFIEPHMIYDEPGVIHAAVRHLTAVLIEGETGVFACPLHCVVFWVEWQAFLVETDSIAVDDAVVMIPIIGFGDDGGTFSAIRKVVQAHTTFE